MSPARTAGDADFAGATGALPGPPDRVRVGIETASCGDAIGECQRRTRGGIELVFVVRLENFDVELRRQRPRGDAHQLLRHGHSYRGVRRHQDCDLA